MKRNSKWLRIPGLAVYTGIASVLCLSCSSNSYEGKIVAVELAGEDPESAQLVLLDPEKPEKEGTLILKDFNSASAPNLSHEGRYLYFQGKEEGGDPWQIWMLDLKKKDLTRITDLPENCTDPASLPDGTVIFSRESQIQGTEVNDLWKIHRDGCCLTRLTFNPAKNLYASVLKEGRVLYSSTQVYPETQEADLMVMRPDGSKSEIYSGGNFDLHPSSGGSESRDGYIYFISGQGQLSRVLHRRPLHTFENLSKAIPGNFAAVKPLNDGSCLVSYRPSDNESFGLYRFDPGSDQVPTPLFQTENRLSDPVAIAAMEMRPRILPSPVDPGNPTALLMSQDINHSMLQVRQGLMGDTLADRIRISTLEGELAVVECKEDGSFYLKVDADQPLRFETLNSQGEIVRGPSDWIYLRPNERRACTGCHADPELAPRNIQPLAVKEDPVLLSAGKKETSY
ncbi:MAG: hypothetical protein ABFS28_00425 [Bacteroidota bacterium]